MSSTNPTLDGRSKLNNGTVARKKMPDEGPKWKGILSDALAEVDAPADLAADLAGDRLVRSMTFGLGSGTKDLMSGTIFGGRPN